MARGMIYNIQRLSTKDGPGIRTVVFFKGCPLRCQWCCNPESQHGERQLLVFGDLCVKCGKCVKVCPEHAVSMRPGGLLEFDRSLCRACGACVAVCPAEARELCGQEMEADEVMRVVKKDLIYYQNTGGGVTFSGGEATAQPLFLLDLLERCFYSGIHTALETSGFCSWNTLEAARHFLNLILYDIKHLDSFAHREFTGVDNTPILNNLKKLAEQGAPVILRIPFIPGKNTSREHMQRLCAFALEYGLRTIHLIPEHGLGQAKYQALGRSQMQQPRGSFGSSDLTPREAATLLAASALDVLII